MLQQAHSHYDSHATVLALLLISELTIKKDIDSEVYLLTIEAHHESISFLFVLLITTSLSAGVLHVPACNHDRPPLPGFTFMYMRCVPYNHPYWLCLSPHPKPLGR